MAELKRTPLYDAHAAAGARLVDFAGWEMPVQYEGVGPEHLAVRSGCGVFDVSHMGEIETSGPQAAQLLQRLLSNDVSKIEVGGAQYSVLCREDGGVLDDLFTYRLADDRFLTVTNASNHERDFAWFEGLASEFDCEVADTLADWAMLAVQGPDARGIVAGLIEGELPKRMHTAELRLRNPGEPSDTPRTPGREAEDVAGVSVPHTPGREGEDAGLLLVCGTGYTGENGVEVMLRPADAPAFWDALLAAGATPAGLGARDTLRLEVCFHLYGNDLSEDRNPIEAGLGWCCKEATGFIGAEAIAAARAEGTAERLAAFTITERGIPRQGNPIVDPASGEAAGTVTSGTHSPSLEKGIGMGYVRSGLDEVGSDLEIDVRGKRRAARIESRPLYAKS